MQPDFWGFVRLVKTSVFTDRGVEVNLLKKSSLTRFPTSSYHWVQENAVMVCMISNDPLQILGFVRFVLAVGVQELNDTAVVVENINFPQ